MEVKLTERIEKEMDLGYEEYRVTKEGFDRIIKVMKAREAFEKPSTTNSSIQCSSTSKLSTMSKNYCKNLLYNSIFSSSESAPSVNSSYSPSYSTISTALETWSMVVNFIQKHF